MDERSQVLLSAILGAVVGAILGGLYLTERGRRVREQIEPALDGFIHELERARGTVEKARAAAHEGRRAFDDAMAAASAAQTADVDAGETTWAARGVRNASSSS